MKNILVIIATTLIISSCTEEISLTTLEDRTAVVAGYIFANQPIDSIRITESISYAGDGTLNTIDGLNVIINDGSEDLILESIGNGYYRNLNHIVQEDRTYSISFEFEGEIVSGESYVNPTKEISISKEVLELEKIEFSGPGGGGGPGRGFGAGDQEVVEVTWENDEGSYYFVDVENVEDDPEYVNGIFEFFEAQGIERPQRFFRSEPEIVDFYVLNTQRELMFFGTYVITVYRLNAEYAALYQSVGTSTLNLEEPPSNIKNGLGIFTAVTPHEVVLEVVKK